MNSRLDRDFIRLFKRLPRRVQKLARENYALWRDNPRHPSLEFKRINSSPPVFSIRIGIHYRAAGVLRNDDTIVWFFIGSHARYDAMIERLG